ncbi:MAG: 2-amino-4-hydroxy-6-hydroxymethyldihydropteridine diphosphokinase [Ktedonobacteraceae bacterium]
MSNLSSASRKHMVYLALGSNLGDRNAHLDMAIARLSEVMAIQCVSSIYETMPVGFLEQSRFLNMVCGGKTYLSPQELLRYVKDLEQAIGRQPTFRNGPRTIDIDILLFDDLIVEQQDLVIPHSRMSTRAFVLVPLAEIAPNAVMPASGQTIQELLSTLSISGVQKVAG